MTKRELTNLEYVVLGLLSLQPHSGYDITSFFEDGAYSWSASPGSVYPMLKRLESQDLIVGELEMQYETRPRKVYSLMEKGGHLLDEWLKDIPQMRPFYEQREIALLRFQFMERRLSKEDILKWINGYLDAVRYATGVQEAYTNPIKQAMEDDPGVYSFHAHLLMEAYIMEINTLRTWLELVKARLQIAYAQEEA
ncbi:MAG: PadR family transcriptional regulator [Chloroflexi bacterium]|nr:PadR family transcriptional regulator [Chloroflexota bacterium]